MDALAPVQRERRREPVQEAPGERIDCGAEKLTCAGEEYGASACVSDLCLASKAGTRKWDPESCPAELAKPK